MDLVLGLFGHVVGVVVVVVLLLLLLPPTLFPEGYTLVDVIDADDDADQEEVVLCF